MNDKKIRQLLTAARHDAAPTPSPDFADDVLRAVRGSKPLAVPAASALSDQLNVLFPRIALAALAVMVLSLATDYGLSAAGLPALNDGMTQLSAQWFFAPGGI